jgi:tripartite-type tricarboxylate transporter receptor subunit TctC
MNIARLLLLPLLLTAGAAMAQAYPARPIVFVSPFPPGGGNDLISRTIAAPMSKSMGQNVIVDNRPGAETAVGMYSVARATPDGYTVILTSSTFAINATLNPKLPYTQKDFDPISLIGSTPYILTVNAASPLKSVNDLIAQTRAKPGQVFAGSASLASRLAIELLNFQTDTKITHVPYKGAALAVTDLMAGRVAVVFATPPTVFNHIRAGKLRGITVTSAKRFSNYPDLPTVAESLKLPGFEASTWYGVIAPARTPGDILKRLSAEVMKAVQDPVARERLLTQGLDVSGNTPEQFRAYIAAETEKWAKVMKFAGVKPEE